LTALGLVTLCTAHPSKPLVSIPYVRTQPLTAKNQSGGYTRSKELK